MITCKEFPNKQFATKQELFKELRENALNIIALKKAAIYKSHDKGYKNFAFIDKLPEAVKGELVQKEGYIYAINNTTRYLDSHDDVHFDGLWKKSLNEQQGKLYYVADHELKLSCVIAYPKDINTMVKMVPWSLVGKQFEGETEALIFEIPKEKIVLTLAKDAIENNVEVQNSVRMQYVKIKLALDSEAKEDIEYKKYFDEKINLIANKEVAIEQGYFFGIEEAKIVKECSMVLFGSNDATAVITQQAATIGTLNTEPLQSTPPKAEAIQYNKIAAKLFIN